MVPNEKSRIRIRIGSRYVPKCHGSRTLVVNDTSGQQWQRYQMA